MRFFMRNTSYRGKTLQTIFHTVIFNWENLTTIIGSWRAPVRALVPPTPDLAEYCYKFAKF